jgi:hypothetical protein
LERKNVSRAQVASPERRVHSVPFDSREKGEDWCGIDHFVIAEWRAECDLI